jgi:gluconate 2-dehydrogenase gamma chain
MHEAGKEPPRGAEAPQERTGAQQRRLSRRQWLAASAGAAVLPVASAAAAALGQGLPPFEEGRADAPVSASQGTAWSWFTSAEAAFVAAAVARLIPADELGPGAVEAGVPVFIDRQLAGAYGRAERWYMQGPWAPGAPTQGWQSRLTPAGMYRAAVRAIDAVVAREGRAPAFAKLKVEDQDAMLHRLEKGEPLLEGVDAKDFFDLLWQNTIEGFWSDPLYGGNRDMAGWKLIGFPGARYDQSPWVTEHGARYTLPPVGLRGRVEWIRG